jgi:hypothetical protein
MDSSLILLCQYQNTSKSKNGKIARGMLTLLKETLGQEYWEPIRGFHLLKESEACIYTQKYHNIFC